MESETKCFGPGLAQPTCHTRSSRPPTTGSEDPKQTVTHQPRNLTRSLVTSYRVEWSGEVSHTQEVPGPYSFSVIPSRVIIKRN
jgi:hypothetical protein